MMNGRQKAGAELPFPKKNSETKKEGQICPSPKKLGHGQTKMADLPRGRKRDFHYYHHVIVKI